MAERRCRRPQPLVTLLSLSLLLSAKPLLAKQSDTFLYTDNGLAQTVAYKRLPGEQREELQSEILSGKRVCVEISASAKTNKPARNASD